MPSPATVTRGPQSAEATVEVFQGIPQRVSEPANTEDPELPMRVTIPQDYEAFAAMRRRSTEVPSPRGPEVALVCTAVLIARHGIDDWGRVDAIRRVYEEGGPLPRPTVTEFLGQHFIMDGHHRFHAAKAAGLVAIEANIYYLPDPDIFDDSDDARLARAIAFAEPRRREWEW